MAFCLFSVLSFIPVNFIPLSVSLRFTLLLSHRFLICFRFYDFLFWSTPNYLHFFSSFSILFFIIPNSLYVYSQFLLFFIYSRSFAVYFWSIPDLHPTPKFFSVWFPSNSISVLSPFTAEFWGWECVITRSESTINYATRQPLWRLLCRRRFGI